MPSIVDEEQPRKYFSNLPVHIARVGRPAGVRNRISSTAKENIQKVFDGLGGWESMMNWALFHQSEFYGQVYPRMLANEGVSKGNGDIRVIVYGKLPNSDYTTNTTSGSGQPSVSECEEAQAIDNIVMSDHAPNPGPR